MPDQQPLGLPKPKMIVSIIFTHNQTLEVMSNRYTEKELSTILDRGPGGPIEFWGCDENEEPVYVSINRVDEMLGYMLRDFNSYTKSQARMRAAQAGMTTRPPLVRG